MGDVRTDTNDISKRSCIITQERRVERERGEGVYLS